jgi:hypothetical protein
MSQQSDQAPAFVTPLTPEKEVTNESKPPKKEEPEGEPSY